MSLRLVVDNGDHPPGPPDEKTDQGQQIVIRWAGRSARQAAAAREAAGHGKIQPKAPQLPAGGMFDPGRPQPDLFGRRK